VLNDHQSLELEMATPEFRNTTDTASLSERVARFMFDLQADDYEADDALRELAWADGGIHDFWLGQADAVISFLGLELCV
jgi:hypothetical protein